MIMLTTSQSGRHKNRAWKRRTSFIAKEKVSNRNLPLEATGVIFIVESDRPSNNQNNKLETVSKRIKDR